MIRKKKGLSPVIATVLLVAMVIVIGLIIFFWFNGMTKEVITKFDKNIEMTCNDVQFSASCSDGTLYITNDGNVPIYGMQVKVYKEGGHSSISLRDYKDAWTSTGLNKGGTFVGGRFGDATSLELIPVLMGSSDSGNKLYVCDKYDYEVDVE